MVRLVAYSLRTVKKGINFTIIRLLGSLCVGPSLGPHPAGELKLSTIVQDRTMTRLSALKGWRTRMCAMKSAILLICDSGHPWPSPAGELKLRPNQLSC